MDEQSSHSRVTLADIAKVVGVSHVTVSLALRDHRKIPEARRLQIQEVARKMGYRPNAMATALAHHKRASKVIPVRATIAWLNHWPQPGKLRSYLEFDRYWKGAYQAGEKLGYRVEEFILDEKLPISRLEKILHTRSIDGILIPPHPISPDWGDFRWERFSSVRFGRSVTSPPLHIITSDQLANTLLAFDKIRQHGYQRTGMITGSSSSRGGLFEAGYLFAQAQIDRRMHLPVFRLNEENPSESQFALSRWLGTSKPDAILTDVAAAREMIEKAGVRVPGDIGLAALSVLDGNADAGIYQNPEEIGRVAVLVVISLITDNDRGIPAIFRQILVEGEWRDGSTLPIRSVAGTAPSTPQMSH